jgi:hypothetical protein
VGIGEAAADVAEEVAEVPALAVLHVGEPGVLPAHVVLIEPGAEHEDGAHLAALRMVELVVVPGPIGRMVSGS